LTLRHLPGLVLGGHQVVVGTGEAVVDQPVGSLAVEVLEQLAEPALPEVQVLLGPADVVPENVRAVAVDEVAQVRAAVPAVLVIPGSFGTGSVQPVHERRRGPYVPVQASGGVDAEPHPDLTGGAGEVADEVPAVSAPHGVPLPGTGGARQGDAVVVLGGQHQVVRTGATEELRPGGRVEGVRSPLVEEVVVGRIAV